MNVSPTRTRRRARVVTPPRIRATQRSERLYSKMNRIRLYNGSPGVEFGWRGDDVTTASTQAQTAGFVASWACFGRVGAFAVEPMPSALNRMLIISMMAIGGKSRRPSTPTLSSPSIFPMIMVPTFRCARAVGRGVPSLHAVASANSVTAALCLAATW